MKIAVIGGGLVGLTTAYEISKQHEVFLFEKENFLGGLMSSFTIDKKYLLDKFYRHIFSCDIDLLKMLRELGLEKNIKWNHSKMGLFYKNEMHNFSSHTDILKFKHLGVVDKIKFAIAIIYISKLKNWRKLENISAEDWLKKKSGKIYNVLWKPLLTSKFGEACNKISMAWFWNKIWYRMQTRKKFMSKEVQGYLLGSFKLIIDKMEKKIKESKGKIFLKSKIKKIYRKKGKIIVETQKKNFSFDKIIFSADLEAFLKITKDLPEDYKEKLKKIEYRTSLVLILRLKKSLIPYYWLNISDSKIPFVMLMEHTNFVSKNNYGGFPILYISKYGSKENKYYQMNKEDLIKSYIFHLKKINPEFDEDWIKDSWLFKSDYGTHIPTLNYSKLLPPHQTPIKGLYLATGCQIYPVDRGMSECIALGKKIVKFI